MDELSLEFDNKKAIVTFNGKVIPSLSKTVFIKKMTVNDLFQYCVDKSRT